MQAPQQQPQPGQTQSALAQYMANYGQHLQSLLNSPTDTSAVGIAPPMAQQGGGSALARGIDNPQATPAGPAPAPQPTPAMPPAQAAQPTQPGAAAGGGAMMQGGDTEFRQRFKETPREQQVAFADKLEQSLERGNQSIDSAYDDLVKQLGSPPAGDEKLTREEKGMFLMEFGLNLMANSSGQAYGQDLGGAIGASGASALQGHRARRGRARERYEDSRLEIEKGRAGAKSRLSEQSALESREYERDRRREAREDSQIASTITQPDDTVVGITKGGQASRLELPGGNAVKSKPKPAPLGPGGGRGFESDRRYQLYMDTYGKDASGAPLEGPELEDAKRKALAFSVDPKAATLSESEMRAMSERSADAFMKSNWSLFRDMSPDEAQNWRNKTADANYTRLKAGRDIELEPPKGTGSALAPKGHAAPSRTSRPKAAQSSKLSVRSFASEADVEKAVTAGEIKNGDTVRVGTKSFKVQVQ